MMSSMMLNDDRSERIRYNNPDYPVYMRRGLLSLYPDFRALNHWHNDVEFICVLSGQMKYNVNGEITELKTGDGLFVNSGQMHFGFSDDSQDAENSAAPHHTPAQDCDFLCIILHPMLLCSVFPFESDFVTPLIQNSRMPFLKLCPEVTWQNEIISELYRLYQYRELPTIPMRALSSLALVWSLLTEHAPGETEKPARPGQDLLIVKNMVGFIQKNYRQKITLAEIAASGAVGQSKCCKLFARYFSQSPNEYLNRYRLGKSMEMLRNTDAPVTEIALSCGFGSGSYYAETFRRMMGVSPTEYRKDLYSYKVH